MKKLFLIILIILPLFSSFSTSWLSEINHDAKRDNKFIYHLGAKDRDNALNHYTVSISQLRCIKNKSLFTKLIDDIYESPLTSQAPDFEYNFWVINIPERETLKEELGQLCNVKNIDSLAEYTYYDLNFDL